MIKYLVLTVISCLNIYAIILGTIAIKKERLDVEKYFFILMCIMVNPFAFNILGNIMEVDITPLKNVVYIVLVGFAAFSFLRMYEFKRLYKSKIFQKASGDHAAEAIIDKHSSVIRLMQLFSYVLIILILLL